MASNRDKIRNLSPFERRKSPSLAELTDAMLPPDTGGALVVADDGAIHVGHFTMTPIGLLVEENVHLEEWQRFGNVLQRIDAAIQWLIGDWMTYGERVWGQTYEQVAQATGYDVKTLYDYAYVARGVQFSVRTEKLSFGHHKLVAALPPDLQREWLKYAAANNLSISQLRSELNTTPPTPLQSSAFDSFFSPEVHRNFKKMLALGVKAGQGDRRARDKFLSQIQEFRRWLEAVEQALQNADD